MRRIRTYEGPHIVGVITRGDPGFPAGPVDVLGSGYGVDAASEQRREATDARRDQDEDRDESESEDESEDDDGEG